MKRFSTIIFASLFMLFLAGCESTKVETKVSDKVHGNTIELTGNPTTGYDWEYTLSKTGIINIEETRTYLGQKDIVGAPSRYEYKITPLKDGKTVLTFEYKRSWENKPASSKVVFNIEVKDNKVYFEEK